jgi:hypothetical protein
MYVYDEFDRTLVAERVAEFRDQVARLSLLKSLSGLGFGLAMEIATDDF